MVTNLIALLLAPILVAATSVDYYRSAFCDAQSPNFFLERFVVVDSLTSDKACHQTPARTMAMKLVDGLDPNCAVLAYNDYSCASIVGAVPANGKCIAASKARIGSWQAHCNTTRGQSKSSLNTGYGLGELKKRGKQRLPSDPDKYNATTVNTSSQTTDVTIVASSVASEILSAINMSATDSAAAAITSSPSVGAALSSAISSGTGIDYNLTSYVTASSNSSYSVPSMRTSTAPSTVTFTGNTHGNSTAILHLGASSSDRLVHSKVLSTILCGMIALFGGTTV